MSCPRIFVLLSCFAGLSAPSMFGQTVVAIGTQAKELKRAAHQLRISVDHLKNARDALNQATDLAKRSSDSTVISQLAQDWTRLDKSKAPAALEDLYSWLSTAARDAADAQSYQRSTSAAQALLRSLVSMDSDRAVSLWQLWPDPPSSLGEDLRKRQNEAGALFAKQLAATASGSGMRLGMGVGPDLTMLQDAAARGDYGSAARLATQLNQTGDKAEALKLVDQAIADFKQREPDQRALTTYHSFVTQLPSIDPDRYLMALNSLLPALDRQGKPDTGGTVTVGDQTMQVTAAEALVIDMCRRLNGRPDLAMKTLNTIPGLKGKLDRLGGIDSIAAGTMGGSQAPVSLNYSIDGTTRTTYNNTGSGISQSTGPAINGVARPIPPMDLYQSVHGKLAKDPALVRQKLAEASKTPDQIDGLINLANRAGSSMEADLADLALEAASRLVMQVEPLQRRAGVLQNLISAYQRIDGEVDADLLQKGLSIVAQLRSEEQNKGTANVTPNGTGFRVMSANMSSSRVADRLETALVAELALDNFDSAMSYLRLMPDEMKLQALLQIVQSLTQGY
ncbi:MAG: hypothetical protein ABSH28_10990 [Acidobacteriota bacterium]